MQHLKTIKRAKTMLIILHLVIENGIGIFSTSSISRKKNNSDVGNQK